MKSTGITRQVDTLGRVVLPKELRRNMGLDVNDALEIYVDGDSIILKKYHPSCIFCDEVTDVINYHGKMICRACLAKLVEEAAK